MTREKSIFAMEYYKLHYALTTEAVEAFDMAIEALEQEPCKVGHWISNAEDDLKISEYTCSNCKGLSDEDSDFCPKCGSYNGGDAE